MMKRILLTTCLLTRLLLPISAMEIQVVNTPKQDHKTILGSKVEKENQLFCRFALHHKTKELFGEEGFPKDVIDLISRYRYMLSRLSFKGPSLQDFQPQGFGFRINKAKRILDKYISEMRDLPRKFEYLSQNNHNDITPKGIESAKLYADKIVKSLSILSESFKVDDFIKALEISDNHYNKDSVYESLDNISKEIEPDLNSLRNEIWLNYRGTSYLAKQINDCFPISFLSKYFSRYGNYTNLIKDTYQVTNQDGIIFKGEGPDCLIECRYDDTTVTFDTWPNPNEVISIVFTYFHSSLGECNFEIDFPAMEIDPKDIHITTDFAYWDKKSIPKSYSEEHIRTLKGDDYSFQWDIRRKSNTVIETVAVPTEIIEIEELDPGIKILIVETYNMMDEDMEEAEKYGQLMDILGVTKEDIISVLKG